GGDHRACCDEAPADTDETARVGRPADERACAGACRTKRHRRGRGALSRRGGMRGVGACTCGKGEVRRRRARRLPDRTPYVPGANRLVTTVGALDRHLALVGFMGAGKSTIGQEVARLSGRPFVDLDREIERRHGPVTELFVRGEPGFRRIEEEVAAEVLASSTPAVIAFGGGAVLSGRTRELLLTDAFTLWVGVDAAAAWERVRDTGRPLAQDEAQFGRLFDERQPLYEMVSARLVESTEDVLLAALEIDAGHRRTRRRNLFARRPLDCGTDDVAGPSRRSDWRQDRDRPSGWEEPRRRIPLSESSHRRPGSAGDAE